MQLWILNPRHGKPGKCPWDPWYDTSDGYVVRAETPDDARQLASVHAGHEGGEAWLDPRTSSCDLLYADGEAAVVLRSFQAA